MKSFVKGMRKAMVKDAARNKRKGVTSSAMDPKKAFKQKAHGKVNKRK